MIRNKITDKEKTLDSANEVYAIPVGDYRHIRIQVIASADADLTWKAVVGLGNTTPTFTTAPSASNPFCYQAIVDCDDNTNLVLGSIGVVESGASLMQYRANMDGADFFGIKITSFTAGDIKVKFSRYND